MSDGKTPAPEGDQLNDLADDVVAAAEALRDTVNRFTLPRQLRETAALGGVLAGLADRLDRQTARLAKAGNKDAATGPGGGEARG